MSAVSGIRSIGSINVSFGKSGGKGAADSLVVGGTPRAHLLPPEIELQKRARSQRRGLLTTLVVVVVLIVLGFGGATASLVAANTNLASEQAKASAFTAASAKYGKVVQLQNQMKQIQAAEPIASAGEIAWQPYFADIQATLPKGMTLTTFSASLDGSANAQSVTEPLALAHIATITLTADATGTTISDWLEKLPTLKGYVAANPGAVTLDTETGHYTVDVTLSLSSKAFSDRFKEIK